MKTRFSLFLAAVALLFTSAVTAQKGLKATVTGKRIDVTINGRFFTSYQFPENEKYPFFYPVNGPKTGASVTSMRNGEYPHHSSLFFGCDRVNGGNYWQEGLERGRIISSGARIAEQDADHVIIADACEWKRPDAPSPVRDTRKITITAPAEGLILIDFEISLEMLEEVTIEKTNHSLFSIRMDPDLSVKFGGTMVNAEGESGEKGTFGKKSSWIDFYGKRGEFTEGIAILQHPSNPDYPAPWFTRDYGFFSPTSLYWPEDDKTTRIGKGETVNLKYRVLVHDGDTQTAGIAAEFAKYSNL
jgi:hypothetical protein